MTNLQNIAFVLIGVGILVLIGWGVKVFFTAGDTHLAIRIAVGGVGAGVLVLIGVAIKDRINKAKQEDFREVEK